MRQFIARLSKREKMVLTVSVIAVLLAVLERGVLHPIIEKIKSFEEEITATEIEMTKNTKILQQRSRIEKEEKVYASFNAGARSAEEITASMLKEIETIAGAAGIFIVDLKPSGNESEGMVKKFAVNVSCEAEMSQLVSFMYLVEKSETLMQVGAFSVSPNSKQSIVNRCDLLIYKIVLP